MRARTVAALALVALAQVAGAQPYVPPHMPLPDPPPSSAAGASQQEPAQAPPPATGPWYPSHFAPPPEPEPAPHDSTPIGSTERGRYEWGLGVLAGRSSHEAWAGPGAGLEASLLYDLRVVRVGALLSTGLGLGAGGVVGRRFRLSTGLCLDVAAEGGLAVLNEYDDRPVRPTAGARAGLTWVPAAGGRYLSLGLAVRHRFARGHEQACATEVAVLAPDCVPSYGGTLAGAFLTWGDAPPDR